MGLLAIVKICTRGYSEWSHDILVNLDVETCKEASIRNGVQDCMVHRDGFINVGLSCIKRLEDL